MSIRTHTPDCAKTRALIESEEDSTERRHVECTCGATYEPGVARATSGGSRSVAEAYAAENMRLRRRNEELLAQVCDLGTRVADAEMQLQRERDASVYAITHAIAWRDQGIEPKGLERVAWHMEAVRQQSDFPYEPGMWAQTGGLWE